MSVGHQVSDESCGLNRNNQKERMCLISSNDP